MSRIVNILAVFMVGLGSITHAEEASQDETMKAWENFVGDWRLTTPNGNTMETSVIWSRSKTCFIHQGENATHVIGWDPAHKSLKAVTFGAGGGHAVGHWKLVGDGPKFSGEIKGVGADGADSPALNLTISFVGKDNWELVIGEGKITAERIKGKKPSTE